MTKLKYSVLYPDNEPDAVFSSLPAARRFLESEAEIYADFLKLLGEQEDLKSLPRLRGGAVSGEQLVSSFERLTDAIDDPEQFARVQSSNSVNPIAIPPSSASLAGQLILGLTNNNRINEAVSVYLWFVAKRKVISSRKNAVVDGKIEYGQKLLTAALASEALPFRNETSKRIAGAMRRAENHSESLREEVEAAKKLNADHERDLQSCREDISARAKRIEGIFLRRERRNRRQFTDQLSDFELDRDEAFQKFKELLSLTSHTNKQQQSTYENEFNNLKELFYSQLRLRAPVKLWEGRAQEHAKNARRSLFAFCGVTFFAVLVAGLVPWAYGDYISQSFVTVVCGSNDPADCTREFSAKGPLTVAGLLLVMSLVLWVIRLQYRIYLSERHLSLDADEKRAFSEAYMAMTEGKAVGTDNEAIVLAALFRPTQDGIIKDDDSSVDLSAAAVLAKQLSRGQ